MKKLVTVGAACALILSLSACGAAPSATSSEAGKSQSAKVTLTFMTNVVGAQADALETVLKGYTAKTGVKVEYSAPGKEYENLMKTKMAANELPDLFTTHGWSVNRYADFLEPVNDQPFYSKIIDQMKSVITDKNGKVYVLPIDSDIAGIVYNVDVLKNAGVDVDSLTTWDKFTEGLSKIKASGVAPMRMGGKDVWTVGQFGDWVAPSFFITNESSNQRAALKAGTFDAATWEKVAGLMDSWVKAGYFNDDVLTADYSSDSVAIANGKAAFAFYGNDFGVNALKANKDVKLGMMPLPSASDADKPSLIAGEKLAVGVWKDSPRKAAALQLLNYLATDDVVKTLATASGNPAGLTGVTPDIGTIKEYLTKYASVRTFPYFDREYLPSGMWDVMSATGSDVLAGKTDAVKKAAQTMQQSFKEKF